MAAPRRSRRLAALAVVALMAMAATTDAARNSSTSTTTPATVAPRTRTPVPDASGSNDSEESSVDEGSSTSEDGSSEVGVVSDSGEGSSSLDDDEPGEVHAASISDSDSGSDSLSSSSSSTGSASESESEPMTTASDWTEYSSADDWKMTPVTVVHARVQGDEPEWDAERATFVSKYGDSFSDKFRSALDTANTASVEGALMYVQAEGINVQEQSTECERKNGMAYVVFYALQLTQSTNSVALYQSTAPAIEYCPYVAMDSGRCTPTDGDEVFPDECYQYHGLQGEADIGPCVGGEPKDSDFRAPYPDTYWFSFPNSCPLEEREDKTDECREEYPGGLCDYGSAPDGETCTFTYRILGYISIDDLVGITSLRDNSTGEYYANYSQFCEAGGVEFSASVDVEDETMDVEESLEFWQDPTNATANAGRAKLMVAKYAELVAGAEDGKMVALPTVEELTASNPPCYLNNVQCADAKYGCRRVGYFQVCEVCSSSDDDDSCVVAPEDFTFPELEVVAGSSSASTYEVESQESSKSSVDDEAASDGEEEEEREESGSDADSDSAAEASNSASTTATAVVTTVWLVVASTSVVLLAAAL